MASTGRQNAVVIVLTSISTSESFSRDIHTLILDGSLSPSLINGNLSASHINGNLSARHIIAIIVVLMIMIIIVFNIIIDQRAIKHNYQYIEFITITHRALFERNVIRH